MVNKRFILRYTRKPNVRRECGNQIEPDSPDVQYHQEPSAFFKPGRKVCTDPKEARVMNESTANGVLELTKALLGDYWNCELVEVESFDGTEINN